MALSDNTVNTFRHVKREDSFKVLASVHIYRGAALGLSPSGYAKPFEGGDPFIGFATCEHYAGATDGGASIRGNLSLAGQIDLQVITGGEVLITLAAVTVKDRGKPVFATSDNAYALIGHPDAFVGYVTTIESSTTCYVRMKEPGEEVRPYDGMVRARLLGTETIPNVITASNETAVYGFRFDSIGAGITAGAGWKNTVDVAGGEIVGTLDNDNEAQNLTIETTLLMAQTYGMSAKWRGRISVALSAATTVEDFDFGLVTDASSTLADAARASLLDQITGAALFHMDGATTNDILATSDDDSSAVGPTDTTANNSTTVNKELEIRVRPSGSVEFWIDGVRQLSSTSFTVGSALTTYWGGILNLEKTGGTTVPAVTVQLLEFKGASLPA